MCVGAVEVHPVLIGRIVEYELIETTPLEFLRLVTRQPAVAMPLRHLILIEEPARDHGPVGIPVQIDNQDLLSDTGNMYRSPSLACVGITDAHPA